MIQGLRTIIDKVLLEPGARAHEPVRDVGGGIRVATVKDPSGNVLGVIENPHFSTANVR
jgi:predicted enzyme related to lactoylglutathione lyase